MMRTFFTALLLALLTTSAQGAAPAGSLADFSRYHGKVVYLDFWASWCVPCRKSFPWLNGMAAKYADDLVVVGINVDSKRADADRFLQKYPASFPLMFDPLGDLAREYRLEGMPSSVLLDRSGKVVHRHIGFREEKLADYEKSVVDLINKK